MNVDHGVPTARTGAQPQPLTCTGPPGGSCGERYDWVWHEPVSPSTGRRWPGRWCAPRHNPCAACAPASGLDHEMEVNDRMRAAGVPGPLVGYRVDASYTVNQQAAESWEDFAYRVRAHGRSVLGVHIGNVDAIRAVHRYERPQWLVLHGPAGTGKTLLMAALARKLLTGAADVVEDLPQDHVRSNNQVGWDYAASRKLTQTIRRKAVPHVEYHRVDDLVRREAIKIRGLDPAPTADAARVDTLLLDELGLPDRPSEAEIRLIERVLCYRADHGLSTALATNRTWEELVGRDALYGRRVADRLRRAEQVEVSGESWRGVR
jgi:DNA replication protein DnaC